VHPPPLNSQVAFVFPSLSPPPFVFGVERMEKRSFLP